MILWKHPVCFALGSYSRFHIEGMVTHENGLVWRVLSLYGDLVASNRKFSWDLVRRFVGACRSPWLIGGDFNEVLDNKELSDGRVREPHLLESFRHLLEDCDLMDLGYDGADFTWRKSSSPTSIQERIDRCLGTSEWGSMFPRAKVSHLEFWNSDHRPLLLSTLGGSCEPSKRPRRFFFEEAWCDEEECEERIREAWSCDNPGAALPEFLECLRRCKVSLDSWGTGRRRELKARIDSQTVRVRKAGEERGEAARLELGGEQRQLDALLEKDEKIWRQRSRMMWM